MAVDQVDVTRDTSAGIAPSPRSGLVILADLKGELAMPILKPLTFAD